MDILNAILLVMLGWLLGLLGPAIQERIRLHYVTKRCIEGFVSELIDTRAQCADMVVVIETKAGRLTKDLLTWQKQFHLETVLPPQLNQLSEMYKRLLKIDDFEFQKVAATLASQPGRGINLKKLELPYTQTKLNELQNLHETGRRRVLEVISRIRIVNQHVDESLFFFKLTFDSGISEENHASAQEQVKAAYDATSNQCRLIVSLITDALEDLRPTQ